MVERKTQMLISVAVLIVVVSTVSFYLLNDIISKTSNNDLASFTQTVPWQVIDSNVTICGHMASLPRYIFNLSIMTMPADACQPTLNVDLISYQSNYYYYSGNYTYTKNR